MRWLHRTIGTVFGAWLMLVGLSGALLAFYWEIDTALTSPLILVDHAPPKPDIDAMLRAVHRAYPDRNILSAERYGLSNKESYPFVLTSKQSPDMAPSLEVFVDPATNEVIGDRGYWTWFRMLRSFHMELFFPGTGERIVGALGVLLLTTVIAGVMMWWSESRKRLGRSLRLNLSAPAPRLLRDIHTVGGIYIALFLAI